LFTRSEKIEILGWSVVKDDSPAQFNISFQLKNSGCADETITDMYVNGKPLGHYGASHNISADGLTVEIDQTVVIELHIPTSEMNPGQTPRLRFTLQPAKTIQ